MLFKLFRLGAILVVSLILVFKIFNLDRPQDLPVVAITQIISHKTLDTVRDGLIKRLGKEGFIDGKTIKIIYDNAHGNTSVAAQITKKFIAMHPKVIVALSTTSAQLLMKPAQEAGIPLVFSAVTDPVAAGLVAAYNKTSEGVTGISDYMPSGPQLEMIVAFVPNIKRLGVLYNPGETNSVAFLAQMEQEAKRRGVVFVRGAVNSTAEAATVAKSLIGKADALFFPNDNTTMAAAAAVAQVAKNNNVPLFANDSESVKDGALAAVAYDRIAMGEKTAEIVEGILSGKSTGSYPVSHDVPSEIVVNRQTVEKLTITIPWVLSKKIRAVSGS
ncbi:MAG: ABC transporter substrate-binding protein [Candidatus Paracaedibacteraceae bacterium]|nr:ABC transporter substrate-binding protein [Candidatus Paracaedibacteraceae bacterium]